MDLKQSGKDSRNVIINNSKEFIYIIVVRRHFSDALRNYTLIPLHVYIYSTLFADINFYESLLL